MNALIKKEIRLLLPHWIAASLVAIVPVWFFPLLHIDDARNFSGLFFLLGILIPVLRSFGQEFTHGTFSLLLTQPVSRARIWWTKVTLLFAASISVAALAGLSIYFGHKFRPVFDAMGHPVNTLGPTTLFLLTTFTGGLWTTLLFRQTVAAFWFTLLIPMFIVVASQSLAEHVTDSAVETLLVLYSVVGFIFAHRLFLRAEDAQWTGGAISLPAWRGFPRAKNSPSQRTRRPLRALLRKEFQLHQAGIVMALGLAGLNVITIGVLKIHPGDPRSTLGTISRTAWFLLWCGVPLLFGSVAVAEERKLGTLESHLCAPVTRRVQIAIKFCVALFLGISLGAFLPWILDAIAAWVGVDIEAVRIETKLIIATVLTVISFYASTFARHTLQALGLAIVLSFGLVAFFAMAEDGFYHTPFHDPLWRGRLGTLICWPAMIATLTILAYTNYLRLHAGWKIWRRNFLALGTVMLAIIVSTVAIYHRVWEFLTPLEPHHGPARFAPSQTPTFWTQNNQIAGLLPDGRVWRYRFDRFTDGVLFADSFSRRNFSERSGYANVALDSWNVIAIQTNGSLWFVGGANTPPANEPTQIGRETNWIRAAGMNSGFLLLKNDGSLWNWGTNNLVRQALLNPPALIGLESDWSNVFSLDWQAGAQKKDGGVWTAFLRVNKLTNELVFTRRSELNSANLANLSHGGLFFANVQPDGTIWIWGDRSYKVPAYQSSVPLPSKFQVGRGSRWISFTAGAMMSVGIRSDGTLWRWDNNAGLNGVFWNRKVREENLAPRQLGTQSDWIAATANWAGIFSLAADGTLWFWENPNNDGWLASSRKPKKIADLSSSK